MKDRIRTVLGVLVVLLSLTALMWSCGHKRLTRELLDESEAAYSRQDYATVLELWTPLAEQGDANGQLVLGGIYEHGQGVTQNYAEAVKWYRKAAEHGNAIAQYNLGGMYYHGKGVRQDYAEAAKWYGKAAERGFVNAQSNLGAIYYRGQGVPQDYVQAHKWYNLAAVANTTAAWNTENRDLAVKTREEVASKMTPAQITEAQKLARDWKPQ